MKHLDVGQSNVQDYLLISFWTGLFGVSGI